MWSDSGEWCKVDLLVLTDLCFLPHRHQNKKTTVFHYSDLSFAACPPSKHKKTSLCTGPPPLPSAKIDFSQGEGGGRVCAWATKNRRLNIFWKILTPIILCPLLKCLSGTTFIYNYSHNFARITTDNWKPPTCKFHIFCNDMDFCRHWWNACR